MLKLKLKLKLLTTLATMSRSTPRQLKKLAMPVGVSRSNTITVDNFGELVPDPKLSSEREYQLLQIPLEDGRFELVSTSLVEIEYY